MNMAGKENCNPKCPVKEEINKKATVVLEHFFLPMKCNVVYQRTTRRTLFTLLTTGSDVIIQWR